MDSLNKVATAREPINVWAIFIADPISEAVQFEIGFLYEMTETHDPSGFDINPSASMLKCGSPVVAIGI